MVLNSVSPADSRVRLLLTPRVPPPSVKPEMRRTANLISSSQRPLLHASRAVGCSALRKQSGCRRGARRSQPRATSSHSTINCCSRAVGSSLLPVDLRLFFVFPSPETQCECVNFSVVIGHSKCCIEGTCWCLFPIANSSTVRLSKVFLFS